MDLGKSLVADSKAMKIMEPSMSTFDYPSIFSKATAMLGAQHKQNAAQCGAIGYRLATWVLLASRLLLWQ